MDKQDELAVVIHNAFRDAAGTGSLRHIPSVVRCADAAAAVRSFMGSDEVVERVARAICVARELNPDCLQEHHEWEDFPADEQEDYRHMSGEMRTRFMHRGWRNRAKDARAALSAAIGEDIGGGRG